MQGEEHIVRYTASDLKEKIARGETLTDWDGPIWVGELPGQVPAKLQITLQIDGDVIDWFKSQGMGYQTRMNAVLRQYMEHEKVRSS